MDHQNTSLEIAWSTDPRSRDHTNIYRDIKALLRFVTHLLMVLCKVAVSFKWTRHVEQRQVCYSPDQIDVHGVAISWPAHTGMTAPSYLHWDWLPKFQGFISISTNSNLQVVSKFSNLQLVCWTSKRRVKTQAKHFTTQEFRLGLLTWRIMHWLNWSQNATEFIASMTVIWQPSYRETMTSSWTAR